MISSSTALAVPLLRWRRLRNETKSSLYIAKTNVVFLILMDVPSAGGRWGLVILFSKH